MKIKTIFIILLTFLIVCLPAFAEEEQIEGQPLIISDDNVNTIEKHLKEMEKYPFAVLQVTKKELIPKSLIKSMKEYVNNGGTIWFYDSRFADFFGMKNSPMEITGLETKGLEAEYGSGKMIGAGIGAVALKGSIITKGIRRLARQLPGQSFRGKWDNNLYTGFRAAPFISLQPGFPL